MELKESICICSTSYHVFNILNLCRSTIEPKSTTLLLLDFGTNFFNQIHVENLRKIFENVIIISVNRKREYFKFIRILLKGKFSKKEIYKNIFTYATEINSRLYAMQYWHKRYSNIFYFEDGLETYDWVMYNKAKEKIDTGFKFFYGKRPLELCKALYVYEPECVINNTFHKPIFELQKVKSTTCFNDIDIKSIFSGDITPFPKKIVFLAAWFSEIEKYYSQNDFIQILVDTIGINQCCIKKHPNDKNSSIIDNQITVANSGCFEVANLYNDMNSYIFISIISTACLTPKLIYDQEPIIIFLYKIFLDSYDSKEWRETDKVIQKIRKQYKNSERIMIPDSLQEYRKCLENIKQLV